MMIRVSFALILAIAGACVEHDTRLMGACQAANPAEELPWLKIKITKLENSDIAKYWFITHGTYEDQPVFIVRNCCPFCDTITPVYNCDGVLLFHLSNQQIGNEKIVWKPADYACTF